MDFNVQAGELVIEHSHGSLRLNTTETERLRQRLNEELAFEPPENE